MRATQLDPSAAVNTKVQIPNSKLNRSSKLQIPNPHLQKRSLFRFWNLELLWNSGFGGWCLHVAWLAAVIVLVTPSSASAAFGVTSSGGSYVVDSGAGLVFKVNQSSGDITS